MKKIVRGNDFYLRIPVRKVVGGEKFAFPLAACEETHVRLCNSYKRYELSYTIYDKDTTGSTLLAKVEGDQLPCGCYALEVRGKLFGCDWRSNEYEQICLVENNASADTEFDVSDEGEDSVEMDTVIVLMGASEPAINPMGEWSESVTYNRGDAVSHDLRCWWAYGENTASEPATGSSDWVVLIDATPFRDELQSAADAATAAAESATTAAANATAATEKADAEVEVMQTLEKVVTEEEAERIKAEAERVSAESGRASAEASRVKAEAARASAESSRVSAENARVSAESARVQAEASRVGAESQRVSAEVSRADAEAARVKAENARVSAESSRVTAEAARVKAEAARESSTSTAIVNCEKATADTESATADAQSATAAAQSATTAAKSATSDANTAAAAAVSATGQATSAAASATVAAEKADTATANAESATTAAKTATENATTATAAAESAATKCANATTAAETATEEAYAAAKKANTAATEAEKVDAELDGSTFKVTNRKGEEKILDLELVALEEEVTVVITSEVSSVSVSGVTISVYTNHGTTPTKYTTDAEGKATFKVGKGSYYEVHFPEFSDANAIPSVGYTATMSERTITGIYTAVEDDPETCYVEVKKKVGTEKSVMEGVAVSVKIGDSAAVDYTTDSGGLVTFTAAVGKTVTVTLEDLTGEGYYLHNNTRTRSFKVYVGGHTEHIVYYTFENGVFIVDADGNDYTIDEWTEAGKAADDAMLLKVVTDNLLLNNAIVYIDPVQLSTRSIQSLKWVNETGNGNNTLLPNAGTGYSYKGQERTQLIIEDCAELGFECPAASLAVTYTKSVGGETMTGYLGGSYQWMELWNNRTAVDEILTALYGSSTNLFSTYTTRIWTSDQRNANNAFCFSSSVGFNLKDNNFAVVPFYAY